MNNRLSAVSGDDALEPESTNTRRKHQCLKATDAGASKHKKTMSTRLTDTWLPKTKKKEKRHALDSPTHGCLLRKRKKTLDSPYRTCTHVYTMLGTECRLVFQNLKTHDLVIYKLATWLINCQNNLNLTMTTSRNRTTIKSPAGHNIIECCNLCCVKYYLLSRPPKQNTEKVLEANMHPHPHNAPAELL